MAKVCGVCRMAVEGEHFCGICGKCKRECGGKCKRYGGRMKVGEVRGEKNGLKRALGVEIELTNWGTGRGVGIEGVHYRIERDGSVHGAAEEMVVDPLVGDAWVEGIENIWEALTLCGAKVDESCGYHVHVDAEDLGWWDLRRVLTVYKRVEGEVFGLCDEYRGEENHYCRKMDVRWEKMLGRMWMAGNTEEIKQCLVEEMYKQPMPECQAEAKVLEGKIKNKVVDRYGGELSGVRYYALNVHSWMHRGTLEWRMHEGTLNGVDMLMWPLFCGWFVEVVGGMSDKSAGVVERLDDVVGRMPEGVRKYVEDVRGRRKRDEI